MATTNKKIRLYFLSLVYSLLPSFFNFYFLKGQGQFERTDVRKEGHLDREVWPRGSLVRAQLSYEISR